MVTSKQGRPFLPPGLCTFFGSFVEFRLFKMGIRPRFFPPPRKRLASKQKWRRISVRNGRFVRDGGEEKKNYWTNSKHTRARTNTVRECGSKTRSTNGNEEGAGPVIGYRPFRGGATYCTNGNWTRGGDMLPPRVHSCNFIHLRPYRDGYCVYSLIIFCNLHYKVRKNCAYLIIVFIFNNSVTA